MKEGEIGTGASCFLVRQNYPSAEKSVEGFSIFC